jgi:hypothetical protein
MATRVQPQLEMTKPGDQEERQAEQGAVQATAPEASEENKEEELIKRARGATRPLPEQDRSFFEPRFGADLGGVRIATGAEAARAARAIDARAFTVGRDIVFGEGEYSPGTARGRHLMAHELAHTLQQSPGRVRRVTPDAGTTTAAPAAGIRSFEMIPGMEAFEVSTAGNPAGFNEGVDFLLRLDATAALADYAIVQLVKGSMSYRDSSGLHYIPATLAGASVPFHFHDWKVDSKNTNPEYGTTHSPAVAITGAETDWGDEPGISPGAVGAELPVPTRCKVWFRTGIYRRPIPATVSAFESSRPAPLAEIRWAVHWRNQGSPPAITQLPITPE